MSLDGDLPPAAFSVLLRRVLAEVTLIPPTLLVSVATSSCFIQVFGSWTFIWSLIGVAGVAHLLGALVRALRPPGPASLLSHMAVIYLSVGWLRFTDTLRFGLPLSRTWFALWSDLHQSWNLIGDVVTPVGFRTGFGTTAAVVIAFVAVTTDAFAARYGGRAEVFVPAAATLFIVAAVGTGQDRVLISTAWMTSVLTSTAWIRLRSRRFVHSSVGPRATRRTADVGALLRSILHIVLIAAIVGGAAGLVGPLLPGAGKDPLLTQHGVSGSRELRPFVDVRRRLNDPAPTVLFTVRADAAAYWRITSLPTFDGSTWTVPEKLYDSAIGELSAPVGASDSGTTSTTNFQRFSIEDLAGHLVPVASTPTQLRSSTQSLFYEPDTGSLLVGGDGLRRKDGYEIVSTQVSPAPTRLASATVSDPPDRRYLEVPDSASMPQLRDVALSIASPNSSPYQRALAIQDFFRRGFTYSLDVPPMVGSDATLDFLERRTGYCENFASTFAIFARILGLPSRVAIGFTPGDRVVSDTGSTMFVVRSQHAHAWPEVWFDGLGWILFEPTPGRGAPNADYTNVPEDEAVEPAPLPPVAPTTTAPPSADSLPDTAEPLPTGPGNESTSPRNHTNAWLYTWGVSLIALVIAWVVGMPPLVRVLARRRNVEPTLRLWRRAVALYELERGTFPETLSPIEIAQLATSRLYDDDPFIFELAHAATRALFAEPDSGEPEGSELLQRGIDYLEERRRRMSPALRLRAVLDPVVIWKLEGG